MPEIESVYSTYAKSADDEGFAESRDHRAFAGFVKREPVTMYHSALCQSLDYFSWFRGHSAEAGQTRTAFEDTIQTGDFAELPIHYLYVASGNFDFALPGQVQDYQALLDIEPRLRSGVNTCFDVFPMRYHSMGNWHLALYNFYRRFFSGKHVAVELGRTSNPLLPQVRRVFSTGRLRLKYGSLLLRLGFKIRPAFICELS